MSISSESFEIDNINKEDDKDEKTEKLGNVITKEETSITCSDNFVSYNLFPSLDNISDITSSKENLLLIFNEKNLTKTLQKSLINKSKQTINDIVDNLSGSYRIIIRNNNGNYFLSDLLKICDKFQRIKILKELSSTISEDCCNEFATHPIQKLIELASNSEEFNLILFSFNDYNKIIMPSLNKYGNYVIQKIIINIPEIYRKNFDNLLVKFVLVLSKDAYGVSVLKRFIKYTKNGIIKNEFFNIITSNFLNISTNKYGNYIIQFLLEECWNEKEGKCIKKIILSKFKILMKNNFSSYICNLYYKLCDNEEKNLIMSQFNNNII